MCTWRIFVCVLCVQVQKLLRFSLDVTVKLQTVILCSCSNECWGGTNIRITCIFILSLVTEALVVYYFGLEEGSLLFVATNGRAVEYHMGFLFKW